MSFAWPLVLLALLGIPLLIVWYSREQRRRVRAAAAFVTTPMRPSVTPRRPRWRRHAPMLAFALAVAALILAAARPQRSVAVPVNDGAVMLADDVSSSMASTDVSPSRLAAAARAADTFMAAVPASVRVGLMRFNQTPVLLQTPSTDHSLAREALTQLHADGHTAIGSAIDSSLQVLGKLRTPSGKRVPSAIVVLSDGTSTTGVNPLTAARQARTQHIPVYTVTVGTARGAITVRHGSRKTSVPVPVSATELGQIAAASGGRAFTASNAGHLSAVYSHLAAQLGHKKVHQEMTATLAGAGLMLLLFGSLLSLRWFGRLI